MDREVIKNLEAIAGPEYVLSRDFELVAYSRAWSYEKSRLADVIVIPGSTEEVSQTVKLANEVSTPVCVRGGGTTTTGMSLPREAGIVLDLNRMDKIEDIDEGSMTVTMQSGASVYEIIKTIEKKGWKIPLKPEFGSGVPIAGWTAFNGIGAGGSIYGRVADMVAGLEVVLPTGEIVNTGSTSFSSCKQFARYVGTGPDLTGLFLNALGTTGIITGETLRVYRIPETESFFGWGFDTAEDAQKGIQILTEANISYGITLFDDHMCRNNGLPEFAPYIVHMFAEGFKEEVDFRLEKGKELLAKAGLGREIPDAIPLLWGGVEGMSSRIKPAVRLVCVGGFHPLDLTAEVFHAYNRVGDKHNFRRGMVWWVINNYANVFPIYIYDEETELDKVIVASQDLREEWSKIGCAPDYPGPNPDITPWITPEYLDLYSRIKKSLDPNNIIHRGMSPIVEYSDGI